MILNNDALLSFLNKLSEDDDSVREYTQDLSRLMSNSETWKKLGDLLFDKGFSIQALSCYENSLKINTIDVDAWYAKGVCLYSLERYDEALKSFEKSLELDPNYSDAWYARGLALDSLQRYDEALKSFEKSLELDPNYSDAWYARGLDLFVLARHAEAVRSFDKAIELGSIHANSWYHKALALEALKQHSEAIHSFDKAIELDPKDAAKHYNRGMVLSTLGRYNEAIESYDKALELEPHYPGANTNKGSALFNVGNYDKAVESYDKALQLEPNNLELLYNLRLIYSAYKYDLRNALDVSRKIVSVSPNYITKAYLAEDLINAGNYVEARNYLVPALEDATGKGDHFYESIIRLLLICSQVLEEKNLTTIDEIQKTIEYLDRTGSNHLMDGNLWKLKGLVRSIDRANINPDSKSLLHLLIDLVFGRVNKKEILDQLKALMSLT